MHRRLYYTEKGKNMDKYLLSLLPNILLCIICKNSIAGYGDFSDSIPIAPEREVHVLTNAVRMDPQGFRDLYIKDTNVLKTENYPPTTPLWYNHDLSRAARFHSIDMANNCGMTHQSCDGTSFANRIKSFYKTSSFIAENVATGRSTGLLTVIQWLRDDINQGVPAQDLSSNDGHRQNIMNPRYNEFGCGYAYSNTRKYNHFWTQDFGGATVKEKYKIPAGCHFNPNSSTLSYAANYYDTSGIAPKSASVFIDGKFYPMTLHLGTPGMGTYLHSTTSDGKEHCYYFVFIDGSGNSLRFPQNSILSTGQQPICENVSTISTCSPRSEINSIRTNQFSPAHSHYRLDGVKITGKLQRYYSSGIWIYGKPKAGPKSIVLIK
ncbi:MAG: CAP domain-containing protein [Fibrobacter sp.]|jgi:uncharacterized protein YkwD|nr:CAP domain-containing protein [Fibrobacter sp.]